MSAAMQVAYIGRTGVLPIHPGLISIQVRIVDVREAFGRTDALVEPLAGKGKQWVSLDRITLDLQEDA